MLKKIMFYFCLNIKPLRFIECNVALLFHSLFLCLEKVAVEKFACD
jgi:hypothetical protein